MSAREVVLQGGPLHGMRVEVQRDLPEFIAMREYGSLDPTDPGPTVEAKPVLRYKRAQCTEGWLKHMPWAYYYAPEVSP